MKEKTNIFETFFRSIYDINSFSVSARRGIKRAIMYILILIIILGGLKSIFLGASYNRQISRISNALNYDDYNIYIENNELRFDGSPIIFDNNEKLTVYIDDEKTTGDKFEAYDELTFDNTYLLLLKDGIIIENPDEKYIAEYSTFLNGKVINNDTIKALTKRAKIIFSILFWGINIMSTVANLVVDYLIIVMVASFVSLIMKMIVKYSALWALVIYASTLPLIIVTLLEIIRPDVNFEATFIIGTLTYLILIFKNIKIEIIERFTKKRT